MEPLPLPIVEEISFDELLALLPADCHASLVVLRHQFGREFSGDNREPSRSTGVTHILIA